MSAPRTAGSGLPITIAVSRPLQLWHKWKSLRNVPFRKSWFVGYDLEGNSYWEYLDRNNPYRLRRKVQFNDRHKLYVDFEAKPQWIQWLRHTRANAPTLEELIQDNIRQRRLKILAEQAKLRWKSMSAKEGENFSWQPGMEGQRVVQEPSADIDTQSPDAMSDEELRLLNAEMRVNMKHPPKKEYADDRTSAQLHPKR